jgi:peroxiredoxin
MDPAQPQNPTQTGPDRLLPSALPTAPLAAGQKAPDFELRTTPDQRVALSSFIGRPIVLVFYPADWSPVCGDQLALYNELHDEWQRHRAQLLGISVDNTWCHIAYAKDRRLRFPLLSDFEPKGDVSRRYGAYDHDQGTAARALFVLDREGLIAWSYMSPVGINPGADGILDALEALDPGMKAQKERAHA